MIRIKTLDSYELSFACMLNKLSYSYTKNNLPNRISCHRFCHNQYRHRKNIKRKIRFSNESIHLSIDLKIFKPILSLKLFMRTKSWIIKLTQHFIYNNGSTIGQIQASCVCDHRKTHTSV